MDELIKLITDVAYDSDNAEKNYKLALYYDLIGQTASAITYYHRAAERTENKELAYECLLKCGLCYEKQGNRQHTVSVLFKHAICLLPKRPEAYFLLSRLYERKHEYVEAYTLAQLSLGSSDFDSTPLRTDVEYPGRWGLIFEKAVSAWHWGKGPEGKELFLDLKNNYFDAMDELHRRAVIGNLRNLKVDIDYEPITGKHKVVDSFIYFNEKELLELRINLLKDHVDKFIICESNYTHSGNPKPFTCKKVIEELGLPKDKIILIEHELPPEEEITVSFIDQQNANLSGSGKEAAAWTRERLQRDAMVAYLDRFSDDTVFINSDCDEIIDPKYIEYFSSLTRKNKNLIIKVPLVLLEGRADMRVYDENNNFVAWENSLFLATKQQLKESYPTNIRSNISPKFSIVRVTQGNEVLQDCGWHFTWMGDDARKKLKAESFIHYANVDSEGNTLSSETMSVINGKPTKNKLLKYSTDLLPPILFELENVKNFLLGESQKPIPLAGCAIVNTPSWVERLLKSIDYPIDTFVILNNNGRGEIDEELDKLAKMPHPFINMIKVCHLPANIGCPGAWNLLIKSNIMAPYWLIINHDVAFTPGFLEEMVRMNKDPEVGLVHASSADHGRGSYECFMIKDWVVQKIGLFDENFYPVYVEDVDYICRVKNASIKTAFMNMPYYHGELIDNYEKSGSQTWRDDLSLKDKLDHGRYVNETVYMMNKWGNWNWENIYSTPFNNNSFPLSYSNYDLEFNRSKYPGF